MWRGKEKYNFSKNLNRKVVKGEPKLKLEFGEAAGSAKDLLR